MTTASRSAVLSTIRAEAPFLLGAVTAAVIFLVVEDAKTATGLEALGLFFWMFGVMMWCAFGVVRHASRLAQLLGEPYGTLVLTLAVTAIEVTLIMMIMITGADRPEMARDTMFAVIMIALNLMVGVALLIGGLRHGEQEFNLQGARSFLSVLAPLAVFSLVLPNFTISTDTPTLTPTQEAMFALVTFLLYGAFVAIQTSRHRSFFIQPGLAPGEDPHDHDQHADHGGGASPSRSVGYHAVLLLLTMLPIVLLSEKLAVLVEHGIEAIGVPAALGGVLVAILVLTPEGISALQAAHANRLQRSVNILLGSALATIGLTVPTVLTVSAITGEPVELGLSPTNMVLLLLTLFISLITFGSRRTNMLEGLVHLVIFFVFVVLILKP